MRSRIVGVPGGYGSAAGLAMHVGLPPIVRVLRIGFERGQFGQQLMVGSVSFEFGAFFKIVI